MCCFDHKSKHGMQDLNIIVFTIYFFLSFSQMLFLLTSCNFFIKSVLRPKYTKNISIQEILRKVYDSEEFKKLKLTDLVLTTTYLNCQLFHRVPGTGDSV